MRKGGPPGVGQLLIAIDADGFAGGDVLADRVAALAAVIEGDGDARLPGARRIALREKAQRDGVAVDAETAGGSAYVGGCRRLAAERQVGKRDGYCQRTSKGVSHTLASLLAAACGRSGPSRGTHRPKHRRSSRRAWHDRRCHGDRQPARHRPTRANAVLHLGGVEDHFLLELHPAAAGELEGLVARPASLGSTVCGDPHGDAAALLGRAMRAGPGTCRPARCRRCRRCPAARRPGESRSRPAAARYSSGRRWPCPEDARLPWEAGAARELGGDAQRRNDAFCKLTAMASGAARP